MGIVISTRLFEGLTLSCVLLLVIQFVSIARFYICDRNGHSEIFVSGL
jgi:hypothetical protein